MKNYQYQRLMRRDDDDVNCGSGGGADTFFGLRVASVFIVLIGSMAGALFPVLARRTKWINVPTSVYDFAKYFGSGVIIATAFIHLLDPAIEELGSPCLDEAWSVYPYALAFALISIFGIFIVEIIAFRWGTAKLAKLGISHDPHGHAAGGGHAAHGPESNKNSTMIPISTSPADISEKKLGDEESGNSSREHHVQFHGEPGFVVDSPLTQILGVAILEFGVMLHSILIGLTLAVDEDFKVLFVVIIFHQTFEGLGIGSRLAYMELPQKYNYVPIIGALLYGITTPLGIAIGLGVRTTYNPDSTTASIVSGILDAISAGILIYTGLVELLAHEFLFNKEMINGPTWKLVYAIGCMILGCGLMALLGRWA